MARQRMHAIPADQTVYVMIDGSGTPTGYAYLDKKLAERHEKHEDGEVGVFEVKIRLSLPDDLDDEAE